MFSSTMNNAVAITKSRQEQTDSFDGNGYFQICILLMELDTDVCVTRIMTGPERARRSL